MNLKRKEFGEIRLSFCEKNLMIQINMFCERLLNAYFGKSIFQKSFAKKKLIRKLLIVPTLIFHQQAV